MVVRRFVSVGAAATVLAALLGLAWLASPRPVASAAPDGHVPRIVAAGTAVFQLAGVQDNAGRARVGLEPVVAAGLGTDYVVLLTPRLPPGGYPFFVPYWSPAPNGFDVALVDVTLGPGSAASYATQGKNYLVDWLVVCKQ